MVLPLRKTIAAFTLQLFLMYKTMSEQKITRKDLKKIGNDLYEIAASTRSFMRVPARLYADDTLVEAALADASVEQLANTAALPGIVSYSLAMPDIHQGYGFPIGGVAATALPHGVISPGGIGYDINCGVRLLVSNLESGEFMRFRDDVVDAVARNVPTGLGRGGDIRINRDEMDKVLTGGARWAVKQGYGSTDDLSVTEEGGGFSAAGPGAVSAKAKERGSDQLGTLGSGNHFLEIQEVTEIYDDAGGERHGLVRWADRRAHPLRLARPGPPGLHRLRAAPAEEPAHLQHYRARP